jgi:hypothetical protein
MCTYLYICTYIHIYTHVHINIYTYMNAFPSVCKDDSIHKQFRVHLLNAPCLWRLSSCACASMCKRREPSAGNASQLTKWCYLFWHLTLIYTSTNTHSLSSISLSCFLSPSLSHTHIHTLDGWTDISVSKVRMMLSEDCSFGATSALLWHCHAAAAGACEFQSLQRAEWRGCRRVSEWKETGRSNFSELLVITQIYRRTPWKK